MSQPYEPPRASAGPPPPPSAPGGGPGQFDFARPFTFVFQDPAWVPKVLIGALFQLLGVFLIGTLFLLGYYARLVRNVAAEVAEPLPAWDDLGTYFVEGLKLFVVILCYVLPVALVAMLFAFSGVAMEQVTGQEWLVGLMGCFAIGIVIPLALVVIVLLPAALLRVITQERFSAAFELGEVVGLVRACGFNYLLAIVVHLVAHFLSQFGILLCFVGVFATGFWALAASSHAFGQAYRLARA